MRDRFEERIADHLRQVASASERPRTGPAVGARPERRAVWLAAAAAAVVALVGAAAVVSETAGGPDLVVTARPADPVAPPEGPTTDTTAAATTTSASSTTTSRPERGEEHIAMQRRELDPDVAAVHRYHSPPWTSSEPPPQQDPDPGVDFGGLAFDTAADPVRLTVTFWRNVEVHAAALRAQLTHPDRVDIVAAPEIDMAALSEDLDRELPAGSWVERPNANTSRYVGRVWLVEGQEPLAERLLARHGTSVQLFVGLFPYPVVAEYGDVCQAAPAADRSDVRLDVTPAQARWRVGESIRAAVTVTNDSDDPITVEVPFWARLAVGGSPELVTRPFAPMSGAGRTLTVEPGATSEPVEVIVRPSSCRAAQGSLVAAGTYDVVVQAAGAEGRATVTIG